MKIYEILKGVNYDADCKDFEIAMIKKNSKEVKNGDVFFNLASDYEMGFKNSKEALDNGASCVFSPVLFPLRNVYKIDDIRSAFSRACANFYKNPASKMKIIGVTGTNGKTTTTHLIAEALKNMDKKVGTIGTMGVNYLGKSEDFSMTTPDTDILQKIFYDMQKSGVEYVVMEVSAHAIEQKRVDGVHFDVGILTNITQDHLDYFGTMENYQDIKLSFLTDKYSKSAVICVDDERVRENLSKIEIPYATYGIYNPSDVFAVGIKAKMDGTEFFANVFDEVYKIKTNLVGEYNIQNVLASLSTVASLGLDVSKAVESLDYVKPVEGRFNVIKYKGKYIIIDFAHTPDGLYNVLKTAREVSKGDIFCVFGCGGNRDADKRPKMGKIAEELSNFVCITNDNPRCENPLKIAQDIEKGMTKPHFVELDRFSAIKKMIGLAKEGDVVLIAGKGGEKYQIIGDKKFDYNDFDTVYRIIKNDIKKEENKEYGN